MGVWDNLLRAAKNLPVGWFTPRVTYLPVDGAGAEDLINEIHGWSPAQMYRKQPHLRTVTSFLGRNTAQLGIHVFETVDESDRRRRRDAVSAQVLKRPNPTMTAYSLKYALVVDKALYDWAYLLPILDPETGEQQLWRIPPAWVDPISDGPFKPLRYRVYAQEAGKLPEWFAVGDQRFVELEESEVIPFKGYDPTSTWRGSSAVESLKGTLIEQVEASKYRMQLWKRGGRVSSVLQRPANAPQWTDDQAKRFRDDWYSNWTGDGSRAGGTPILEDGMVLQRVDFSAMDQQWAEGARLALGVVASAFHVNPSMVGSMEKATYNNVREYRKMLYGDTLGPLLVEFEDVLNSFLLPRYGEGDLYAEFNIWAKLAGSFEEQAQFLQAAVGAPYMVRNEARARLNLPAVPGGDELITPLNVLVGGMANPQDSGSEEAPGGALNTDEPKGRRPIEIKSQVIDRDYVVKYQQMLATFYLRQGRHVESRVGAKASWWDQQRWNAELAEELVKMHLFVTQAAALEALSAAGLDDSAYDVGRTVAYLMERAKRDSDAINRHTKKLVIETLKDGKPVNELFAALATAAALKTAQTMATASISWGKIESGRQSGAGSKTWVVTSKNPRSSHSAMGGQMVPLESTFSNGLHWPGDPAGGVAEVAGCTCQVNVVY